MSVEFVNPDSMVKPVGYAHGAVGSGRPVVLAGQIGCDISGKLVADTLVPQFGKALDNMVDVLAAAGGSATDVALLRIYTTDVDGYRAQLKELGAEYRARFGRHFPAMALLGVTQLFEPGCLVEIEGLAYVD